MGDFFHRDLVVPLLNVLIYLYETAAFGNLGVAVIEMTVLLRIALLPLTVVSEADELKYEKLEAEVALTQQHFKNDRVQAHEEIRALLKKNHISSWAKTAALLIQLLALVVLYNVFVSGINAQLSGLYSWVPMPDLPINTHFLGFEIGAHNFWWALAVGVFLYVEIVWEQRHVAHLLGPQDAVFRYAFPIFSVVVLLLLPMVKSLFVLTTMFFSLGITLIRRMIWRTGSTS
jgi:membrane protein insertase Oxa1/YidC/SpoIIIJ